MKDKHDVPDLNKVLDQVEEMMKSGKLDELPSKSATEPMKFATEQEALGGFAHIDDQTAGTVQLDPHAAERIHGKPNPRVHVETYGCQMNTKNTTKKRVLPVGADEVAVDGRTLGQRKHLRLITEPPVNLG